MFVSAAYCNSSCKKKNKSNYRLLENLQVMTYYISDKKVKRRENGVHGIIPVNRIIAHIHE